MKRGLLRFGLSVLTVLALVVMVDTAVGKMMDWMLPQISNLGDTGKTFYSLNDVKTPIVIVGSSRAAHHYVTDIIEDSFGLPSYNVARDGCFFSYNCCIVNSIMDRYIPDVIIWENDTDALYDNQPDPLESLYPYFNKIQWVTSAVKEELPWEEYFKLNSKLYQYNSTLHRVLMRFLKRKSFVDDSRNGYVPLAPKNLRKPLELKTATISNGNLSETKVERFRMTLSRARDLGIKMIIVDSPKYLKKKGVNLSAKKMASLCEEYGMKYYDNSQHSLFWEHPEYFNDPLHLNDNGAKLYTKMFVEQILH